MAVDNDYTPESYPKNSIKELTEALERVRETLSFRNQLEYNEPSVAYTCAIRFLESLCMYLGSHPDEEINLGDVMIYKVVNRPDRKGEKAGNIVPDVQVGPAFLRIFEHGFDYDLDLAELDSQGNPVKKDAKGDAAYFVPEKFTEGYEDALKAIALDTMKSLEDKNNLDTVEETVAYTCTVHLFKNIALLLKENPGWKIEMGSYHVFTTTEVDGKIYPHVECGENFKLGCKDDDATEE